MIPHNDKDTSLCVIICVISGCSNKRRQTFMLHLCCSQWDRRREQLSAGRLHCCQSTGKCPPGASLNFNGSREENSANKASHGIQRTLILPDVCQRTTSLREIASSVTSLPGFLLFLRTCLQVTY